MISNIECDLLRLQALLPSFKIVWSEILQRRYWHHANDSKAVENAHKRMNRESEILSSFGGYTTCHITIPASEKRLSRYEGTHLSNIGINIYHNTIYTRLQIQTKKTNTWLASGKSHVQGVK